MKSFNLDEYLKNPSRKVVTRDGKNVTIHCTNCLGAYSIIAEIEGENYSTCWDKDGRYLTNTLLPSENDLFFALEKHEGWINVFKNIYSSCVSPHIFKSKEDAKKVAKIDSNYVATIKIEWEE